MTDVDEPILYVDQETMSRLIASERAIVSSTKGVSKTSFAANDHRYPGTDLLISREVVGNSVHRKIWVPEDQRFIFEYVGDV